MLPYDITELIVAQSAHADLPSLSLASKSLLALSQPRIFEQVSINSEAHAIALQTLLRSSPHLAQHMTQLEITQDWDVDLPSTMALLQNVKEFTLGERDGCVWNEWKWLHPSFVSAVEGILLNPNLTSLTLRRFGFSKRSLFGLLECRAVHLASLAFVNSHLGWHTDPDVDPNMHANLSILSQVSYKAISTVENRGTFRPLFFQLLRPRVEHPSHISRLHISSQSNQHDSISQILLLLGPSLHNLCLEVQTYEPEWLRVPLSFHSNTGLETLSLNYSNTVSNVAPYMPLSFVSAMLSTFPSSETGSGGLNRLRIALPETHILTLQQEQLLHLYYSGSNAGPQAEILPDEIEAAEAKGSAIPAEIQDIFTALDTALTSSKLRNLRAIELFVCRTLVTENPGMVLSQPHQNPHSVLAVLRGMMKGIPGLSGDGTVYKGAVNISVEKGVRGRVTAVVDFWNMKLGLGSGLWIACLAALGTIALIFDQTLLNPIHHRPLRSPSPFSRPSQIRIFEHISISSRARAITLQTILDSSPHLAPLVTRLDVTRDLHKDLPSTMSLLQNVKEFTLGSRGGWPGCESWDRLRPSFVSAIEKILSNPSLLSFRLRHFALLTPGQLGGLLEKAATHLESFGLEESRFYLVDSDDIPLDLVDTIANPSPSTRLSKLSHISYNEGSRLEYSCLDTFFCQILRPLTTNPSTIHTLHLHINSNWHNTVCQLLTHLGSSLCHLCLEPRYYDPQFDVKPLSFYTNTSLETLSVNNSQTPSFIPLSFISSMLSTFSAPSELNAGGRLEHLRIALADTHVREIHRVYQLQQQQQSQMLHLQRLILLWSVGNNTPPPEEPDSLVPYDLQDMFVDINTAMSESKLNCLKTVELFICGSHVLASNGPHRDTRYHPELLRDMMSGIPGLGQDLVYKGTIAVSVEEGPMPCTRSCHSGV
ncbi:hypothetical protein DFP72DRAFT_871020 [Ephemerocybe angulata]|uniref:Uncharacterized protein n=1 Tax=Ephemerocybe angulata TaxID=980116 RepID=A0A8H6MD73_9AGAR|nr:hypothetical protein DFP72DRAFT_871020 [Tulosesus angulatus]